jgi:hypothetical protein
VAVLAAAALLLGGVGISRVLTHDEAKVPTQVLGEHFTSDATSTTVAPAPASAPPTTAVPRAASSAPSTAAPRRSSTTKGPPQTLLRTVISVTDCGAGDAGVRSAFKVVSHPDPDSYVMVGKVDVVNNLGHAIEVDKLAVRVSYGAENWDVVKFPSANGTQVQPAETKPIDLNLTAEELPTATSVESLDYHLVGLPQCTAHLQAPENP